MYEAILWKHIFELIFFYILARHPKITITSNKIKLHQYTIVLFFSCYQLLHALPKKNSDMSASHHHLRKNSIETYVRMSSAYGKCFITLSVVTVGGWDQPMSQLEKRDVSFNGRSRLRVLSCKMTFSLHVYLYCWLWAKHLNAHL